MESFEKEENDKGLVGYNLDLLSPGAWRYVFFYLGLYKAEREKGHKDG